MLLSRESLVFSPRPVTQSDYRAEEAMSSIHNAAYVSLHVRKSNKAAIALYRDTLGFEVAKVEKAYCASKSIDSFLLLIFIRPPDGDGEDAFSMRLSLKPVPKSTDSSSQTSSRPK